jgi:hypothetical protein
MVSNHISASGYIFNFTVQLAVSQDSEISCALPVAHIGT